MIVVVSNTSPITNLAAIGQIDLLKELYGEIHIAEGVWQELNAHGKPWPGRNEVAYASWVKRHVVENQNMVMTLIRDLDKGEAESIVLALEINATLIILDEKDGRHLAQRLGLRVTGVIGVLLEAKTNGLIDHVKPYLDALRYKVGFYMHEKLYRFALTAADEQE